MKHKYLGDSYDLVKRQWVQMLDGIAPLYAHPAFFRADDLIAPYTRLTTIPMLSFGTLPERPFGLLFDPDTGVPLPDSKKSKATLKHAPLKFIVQEYERLEPLYAICFDQSRKRKRGLDIEEQHAAKREYLRRHGISSFYYLSHAPFLFTATNRGNLERVRQKLISEGIPETVPGKVRLQPILGPD